MSTENDFAKTVEGVNETIDGFFEAYSVGLCYASVCTNLPDDVAAASLNLQRPTGVTPWQIADEPFTSGEPNPTPCPDRAACRHILFIC